MGQGDQVKICQTGRQFTEAELRMIYRLISENGKVKLITLPPDMTAQQ